MYITQVIKFHFVFMILKYTSIINNNIFIKYCYLSFIFFLILCEVNKVDSYYGIEDKKIFLLIRLLNTTILRLKIEYFFV